MSNLKDLTLGKHLSQTVQTNKDGSYPADIIIPCTGLRPNNALTKKIFGKILYNKKLMNYQSSIFFLMAGDSKFNDEGRIKVNDELMVIGENAIYAIGDCCDTKEVKMAAHCKLHGDLITDNIVADVKGEPKKKYGGGMNAFLLTIGAQAGVGQFNGNDLTSEQVSDIKGKGLFTARYWETMEQDIPSS